MGQFSMEIYAPKGSILSGNQHQYLYLRPDLGTEVFQYREISRPERALDCPQPEKRENATSRLAYPTLTDEARDHICRFFAWDLQASA
jgi:hypothetical protein